MRDTVKSLLAHCEKRGGLTLSDLAFWLERPPATVRSWKEEGRVPSAAHRGLLMYRLRVLEELVDTLPHGQTIPLTIRQGERRQYLQGLRDDKFKVPGKGAA